MKGSYTVPKPGIRTAIILFFNLTLYTSVLVDWRQEDEDSHSYKYDEFYHMTIGYYVIWMVFNKFILI